MSLNKKVVFLVISKWRLFVLASVPLPAGDCVWRNQSPARSVPRTFDGIVHYVYNRIIPCDEWFELLFDGKCMKCHVWILDGNHGCISERGGIIWYIMDFYRIFIGGCGYHWWLYITYIFSLDIILCMIAIHDLMYGVYITYGALIVTRLQ